MILQELCRYAMESILPNTDKFGYEIEVESLTYSNPNIICKTILPHKKTVNSYVLIKNSLVPNIVSKLSLNSYFVTVTTNNPHDYVNLSKYSDRQKVYITGCENLNLNGEFEVYDVIDEYNYRYKVSEPGVIEYTENIISYENLAYGYNGYFKITNIIDETTFSCEIDYELRSPAGSKNKISVCLENYISGYLNFMRFLKTYADLQNNLVNKDKFRLGITIGDTNAIRSNHTTLSTERSSGDGYNYRQLLKQIMSVYILCPCVGSENAMNVFDSLQKLTGLIKSGFIGRSVSNYGLGNIKRNGLYFISEGLLNIQEYQDKPFFIYVYNFGVDFELSMYDTFLLNDKSIKIHNFENQYYDENNNLIKIDRGEI